MAKSSSGASGDVLVLHEDGTVTIGWDEFSCKLRRPKAGEWLSFMEESEAADLWAQGEGDPPAAKTLREALDGGPFLVLYQRLFAELAGTNIEVGDLPPWLAVGDTFRRVSQWWMASPLSRADLAAVTRTLRA